MRFTSYLETGTTSNTEAALSISAPDSLLSAPGAASTRTIEAITAVAGMTGAITPIPVSPMRSSYKNQGNNCSGGGAGRWTAAAAQAAQAAAAARQDRR